jgi:hypothetical protein
MRRRSCRAAGARIGIAPSRGSRQSSRRGGCRLTTQRRTNADRGRRATSAKEWRSWRSGKELPGRRPLRENHGRDPVRATPCLLPTIRCCGTRSWTSIAASQARNRSSKVPAWLRHARLRPAGGRAPGVAPEVRALSRGCAGFASRPSPTRGSCPTATARRRRAQPCDGYPTPRLEVSSSYRRSQARATGSSWDQPPSPTVRPIRPRESSSPDVSRESSSIRPTPTSST